MGVNATEEDNNKLFFTPAKQMEYLDRAPVALPASGNKGIFLSWRILGTDEPGILFDIVRATQECRTTLIAREQRLVFTRLW